MQVPALYALRCQTPVLGIVLTMPNTVKAFWCAPASKVDGDNASSLIRRCNEMYNEAVGVLNDWRAFVFDGDWIEDAVVLNQVSTIKQRLKLLHEEGETIDKGIRKNNSTQRQRKPSPEAVAQKEALRDRIRAEREQVAEIINAYKATPEGGACFEAVDASLEIDMKRVRRAYPELGWGSRERVLASISSANKKRKWPRMIQRIPPWEMEQGTLSIRFQTEAGDELRTIKDLVDDEKVVLFNSLPPEKAYPRSDEEAQATGFTSRRQAGKLRMAPVRFDFGDGKKSQRVCFNVLFHRALSTINPVTIVQLSRKEVRGQTVWTTHLTMREPRPKAIGSASRPTCALDIGWRFVDNKEIRFAFAAGSDSWVQDCRWTLLQESNTENVFDYLSRLQHERDQNRNSCIAELIAAREASVPTWFSEHTTHVSQWKKIGYFFELHAVWSKNRFDGDDCSFECLTTCLKTDEDLYARWSSRYGRLLRQRKNLYLNLAHTICERYGCVLLEGAISKDGSAKLMALNGKIMKERPSAEADHTRGSGGRASSQKAAPGEFRTALLLVAPKYGTRVQVVDSRGTTSTHAPCGNKTKQAPSVKMGVQHFCSYCNVWYDRDFNAAHEMLARGLRGEVFDFMKEVAEEEEYRSRFAKK